MLAVCALALSAGCGGIGGDSPTATRSPVDVPARLPPGVAPDGSVDARALLSNHSDALRGRSVTVRTALAQRYVSNGTPWYRTVSRTAYGDDAVYSVSRYDGRTARVFGGENATVEAWQNGTVGLRAVTVGGSTSYSGFGVGSFGDPDCYRSLLALFSTLDPSLADRPSVDGSRVFVLRADDDTFDDQVLEVEGGEDPRNLTFVARVTRGGVLGYEAEYDLTVGNATVRTTLSIEYAALGETTAPRPDWLDEARAAVCSGPERPEWCEAESGNA